jgi:hypothetical protein
MADSTNRWCVSLSGSLGASLAEREIGPRHGGGERGVARALLLSLGLEHGWPDEAT